MTMSICFMSEVLLYRVAAATPFGNRYSCTGVQGYIARKKLPPPRTLH